MQLRHPFGQLGAPSIALRGTGGKDLALTGLGLGGVGCGSGQIRGGKGGLGLPRLFRLQAVAQGQRRRETVQRHVALGLDQRGIKPQDHLACLNMIAIGNQNMLHLAAIQALYHAGLARHYGLTGVTTAPLIGVK